MGVPALQPQLSAVSISSKSASSFTLPMLPPRQASCTASVSLRREEPKALKATSWDWTAEDVALLKHTAKQQHAAAVDIMPSATQPPTTSAKPSPKSERPAAAPKSAVEKLLNFVTVMWTGGAAHFQGSSSDSVDEDPHIPYWQQMDAFAAAFGPLPMGSAVTGAAPLGPAYSQY